MANLVSMLSALSTEYKAAKQAGTESTPAAKAAPPKPPQEQATPPAAAPTAAVAESGGGAEVGKDDTRPAAVAYVIDVAPAEAPKDSGNSQSDRAANRDRTPPPGKAAKAVSKKSDEELLGPRRQKAGAGDKAVQQLALGV